MKFTAFIQDNLDTIIEEWSTFAKTLLPSAGTMSNLALRDHCREILLGICADMQARQTEAQRTAKSKQMEVADDAPQSAAATHGGLRHLAGFDLLQLVGEFRALRASVLALWRESSAESSSDAAIEEVIRFNEALDKALAESIESYSARVDSSRDMFLAVLGHDLRGPLSGIYLSSKLLEKPGVSEASRLHAATRIGLACKTMTGLITDLLEFTRSRLGAGIPIDRTPCDLRSICEEALESARTGHPQMRLQLVTSGELKFEGDSPRLHQVLSNLLSNALQHGDRNEAISLTARGEANRIVVEVSNKGRPIRPEKLPVIFEPLVQATDAESDEVDERSKTSLGLGLYIVREIVLGHGGDIVVSSSVEAGTVFRITLPRTM